MTTPVKHLIKFIFPEKSICDICSFKVCVQRSEELKVGVGLGGCIFGEFVPDGFLKVVKVWGEHFFCVFIPFYLKSLYPSSSTYIDSYPLPDCTNGSMWCQLVITNFFISYRTGHRREHTVSHKHLAF
jgi:hypothetical protein